MNNTVIGPKVRITFYHSNGNIAEIRLVNAASFDWCTYQGIAEIDPMRFDKTYGRGWGAAAYQEPEYDAASICPGGRTEFEII